jgi:pyrrolidone-carboxylate peptidase
MKEAKKYKDFLKAGKETLDEMKVPFQVRKAKKQLEKEIIEIEEKIATQELNIQEAKGEHPFNLDKILDAIDDMAIQERKLKQANNLMDELF